MLVIVLATKLSKLWSRLEGQKEENTKGWKSAQILDKCKTRERFFDSAPTARHFGQFSCIMPLFYDPDNLKYSHFMFVSLISDIQG